MSRAVKSIPILPRPQPVLSSQPPSKPCGVCGRIACPLSSHKNYLKLLKARQTPQTMSVMADGTVQHSAIPHTTVQNQYPVVMDTGKYKLLTLWVHEWSLVKRGPERHLFPARWIDQVFPAAEKHELLFQTLLAAAGCFWAAANDPSDHIADQHLKVSQELLMQTCTEPAQAVTDESILALVLLTLIHLTQGNIPEVEKHFRNVVVIVASRGGPHYLGMSGIVAESLLHADYRQSVYLDRGPAFKLPLPALDVGVVPRLGVAFRQLLPLNIFHPSVASAADSLCKTTDIFESLLTKNRGAMPEIRELRSFGYLSSISEYQLACCHSMFRGSYCWNECLCLALLLFNNVVLHAHGAIDPPIQKVAHRFWAVVETLEIRDETQEVPPCLLLWVLMTGLTPCLYSEYKSRRSAVERMRAAKMCAAIHGWDHFQNQVLNRYLWLRAAQEEVFYDIWLEVEGLKRMTGSSLT